MLSEAPLVMIRVEKKLEEQVRCDGLGVGKGKRKNIMARLAYKLSHLLALAPLLFLHIGLDKSIEAHGSFIFN